MKIFNTKIKGLKIIALKKHKDERGSLFENFDNRRIKWDNLIFDYVSTSKKNVYFGCDQIIKLYKDRPDVFSKNKNLNRDEGYKLSLESDHADVCSSY